MLTSFEDWPGDFYIDSTVELAGQHDSALPTSFLILFLRCLVQSGALSETGAIPGACAFWHDTKSFFSQTLPKQNDNGEPDS